jgi:hypothetical protein
MLTKIRFRLFIFFLLLCTFFILAFQAAGFGSIEELLIWIAAGGGSVFLAGAVISLLLENWKAWHNFPRWVKVIIPVILAGVIGTFAQTLLALEAPALIPPAYASLILVMLNWLSGQWQYMKVKDGAYARSAQPSSPHRLG